MGSVIGALAPRKTRSTTSRASARRRRSGERRIVVGTIIRRMSGLTTITAIALGATLDTGPATRGSAYAAADRGLKTLARAAGSPPCCPCVPRRQSGPRPG